MYCGIIPGKLVGACKKFIFYNWDQYSLQRISTNSAQFKIIDRHLFYDVFDALLVYLYTP